MPRPWRWLCSPAGTHPPPTPGPGSRAAGPAMAFKLIEAALARWRAVNAPQLVVLVRAGATFEGASSSNDPTRQSTRTHPRQPPKKS